MPACVVRTGSSAPPPTGPPSEPASGSGATATPPPRDPGAGPTPSPILNPPRPGGGTVQTPPPARPPTGRPDAADGPGNDVVQGDPGQASRPPSAPSEPALRSWTVVAQSGGKGCYAVMDVACPPPTPTSIATCNPPAPQKVATCPTGLTPSTPVKVRELTPGACFVVHPAPACPAGASCNPPRPTKTDCPTW